ncbi:MAG: hypothetical protein JNJ49_00900 [Bdellovibrionaceae bacterium]|nr:hypothetical protein [Pseudobdellovibrionaceae bacterium]
MKQFLLFAALVFGTLNVSGASPQSPTGAMLATGKPAEVLFSMTDVYYSQLPDDFVRNNSNETSYTYQCKLLPYKKTYRPILCEGPAGVFPMEESEKLAKAGLAINVKLERDPAFDRRNKKAMAFFFSANCLRQESSGVQQYKCEIIDHF